MPSALDQALHRTGRRLPAKLKSASAAAAAGNASFLGIGYLILGRRLLAVTAAAGSILLLLLLAADEPPAWPWRAALLAWWLAAVVHGGHLGAKRDRPAGAAPRPGRGPRAAAPAAFALTLIAVAAVAVNARWAAHDLTRAHEDGDCDTVEAAAESFGPHHGVVDPWAVLDADDQAEACAHVLAAAEAREDDPIAAIEALTAYLDHPAAHWDGAGDLRSAVRLETAAAAFGKAYTGGSSALGEAFDLLGAVVESDPDQAGAAQAVVDDFTEGLTAAGDHCRVYTVIEWIGANADRVAGFGGVTEAAEEVAPEAVFGCAEDAFASGNYSLAEKAYRQFADEYPDHEQAGAAQAGLEVAMVRRLLSGWPESEVERPAYCDSPAPFAAAPAYSGSGPHRMALFGFDTAEALPPDWLASDITDAALLVCAGEPEQGAVIGSCDYTGGVAVDLYSVRYPVEVFAVRTGELVYEGGLDMHGGGEGDCPFLLDYYGDPPESETVTPTDQDARDAFASLVEGTIGA